MTTPLTGTSRSLDQPDEHITKGDVEIDAVQFGDFKVRRASYPAGWRYSTHMGAPRCNETHVGYMISGALVVEPDVGEPYEIRGGSVFAVAPGHDAYVSGDEAAVLVQFDEGESAAKRFNVKSLATIA
jgi:hypothetical protein